MIKKISCILLAFLSGLCFAKSGLHFVEEDLSFGIKDSVFSVMGVYYFSPDKPMNHLILYPFPDDDLMGEAYNIFVKDMDSKIDIPFKMKKDKSGITFLLNTKKCTSVYIGYKQRLFSDYARYILLSTYSWQEPIKRVEYKLNILDNINITYFSIEPDNQLCLDFGSIYFWQRDNFLPPCDMIFKYKVKDVNDE